MTDSTRVLLPPSLQFERHGADEVIVLTAPHLIEEFFHRDWASRARHKVGVPVLKLFAHNTP